MWTRGVMRYPPEMAKACERVGLASFAAGCEPRARWSRADLNYVSGGLEVVVTIGAKKATSCSHGL